MRTASRDTAPAEAGASARQACCTGCGELNDMNSNVATSKNLEKKLASGPYVSNELFRRIAARTSHGVGSPWAFVVAFTIVATWGITGPLFKFSDTWQLVINTGTTIVTFLMVFLIQNTQNRDSHAVHLKLDELIRAIEPARNSLMGLEDLTDAELAELQAEFKVLARSKLQARASRTPRRHHQGGAS
jgi:low affinity Fe/Cu permease